MAAKPEHIAALTAICYPLWRCTRLSIRGLEYKEIMLFVNFKKAYDSVRKEVL
jgi:hypothetical protein